MILPVRVTPRSAEPGVGSWRMAADGREELEVRVSAAPADGAANDAVIRVLADALGIPRSTMEIVSGQTSRHKRIRIDLPDEEVRRRLG